MTEPPAKLNGTGTVVIIGVSAFGGPGYRFHG